MARSTRAIFRNMQGRTRHNFNWDAISQESAVVITAAMFQFSGGIFGAEGRPVLVPEGQEPNVYVTNIGLHGRPRGEAGGVEFLVPTESNAPVDVAMVRCPPSNPVSCCRARSGRRGSGGFRRPGGQRFSRCCSADPVGRNSPGPRGASVTTEQAQNRRGYQSRSAHTSLWLPSCSSIDSFTTKVTCPCV
jgi:hypothetical protein